MLDACGGARFSPSPPSDLKYLNIAIFLEILRIFTECVKLKDNPPHSAVPPPHPTKYLALTLQMIDFVRVWNKNLMYY